MGAGSQHIISPVSTDDDENEEDDSYEAEQTSGSGNKDEQPDGLSGSGSGNMKDDDEELATSGLSPLSEDSKSLLSPHSDIISHSDSPSQSELMQPDNQSPVCNGNPAASEEPVVDSSNHASVVLVSPSKVTKDPTGVSPATANGMQEVITEESQTQVTNGSSPASSPRITRSQKRKRVDTSPENSQKTKHANIQDR